jgi:hypothetical protein
VVADFNDVQLGGKIKLEENTFKLAAPPAAKRVHFFVRPPTKVDLPSPLFGEVVRDFGFTAADGSPVSKESLKDKIAVLAWFVDRPEALATLKQLQRVRERYQASDRVAFYAVSPVPEAVETEQIQGLLDEHQITLPLARDLAAQGREVFDIPGAPTVVVLDGEHRVQAFEDGANPQMEELLTLLLDALLKGSNPAGEVRAHAAQAASDYRRELAAARAHSSGTEFELPEVHIAPARGPEKLKLTKLWSTSEIKSPGNLLVVEGESGPTIIVCDQSENWRSIALLDASGKIVARRTLPVPENAAISLLRTAVDQDGQRWYAGSARLARQVYLFNEKWELATAYPAGDARHDGVGDFALVDFKGLGELQLCVGFWGTLGVQSASLQGERQWTNRYAAPAVSLSVSLPNEIGWRQLLVTTDRGEIVPINAYGKNDKPTSAEQQPIVQIVTGNFAADAPSPYMGTWIKADGTPWAVALSATFTPLWDIPLGEGAHRNQIQPITSGSLWPDDPGHWIFALADGSVGLVAADMSFVDTFALGEALTGIAVAKLGTDHVLLIATAGSVSAYRVQAGQ